MTSTKSIAAAVKSIPGMKEKLRKAFEELQSHSSSLSSFNLQWKDLDDHFSCIEKSIEVRLKELESKEKSRSGSDVESALPEKSSPVAAKASEVEATPRPELKSFCVKLDGKGLLAFINENRKDITEIRKEINSALRSASDPAKLVLEAVEGFHPLKTKSENQKEELQTNRRTCLLLLERLHVISPEIKSPIKEKAKKLAVVWKGRMPDSGDYTLEAFAFLQLLASYGLTSEFKLDEVLDLIVLVSRRKQTIDLCRDLDIADKVPDLIQKLSSKGKQLDAVKFVYAFDLVDKFPPVPLLKAHIKESKKAAQEVRKRGNNSLQAQNEATAKELAAVRAVTKAIEEYKLQSDYPRENLDKRIAQLEKQKAEKKRNVQHTAASNSKSQQQQHANKRPRPSIPTTTAAVATHPIAPLAQSQPLLGLTDRAPYFSSAGPYVPAGAGSVYEHLGSSLVGNPQGMAANRSLYPSDSLMSLYDRPASYGSYPLSGGFPSQYNPSLYHH